MHHQVYAITAECSSMRASVNGPTYLTLFVVSRLDEGANSTCCAIAKSCKRLFYKSGKGPAFRASIFSPFTGVQLARTGLNSPFESLLAQKAVGLAFEVYLVACLAFLLLVVREWHIQILRGRITSAEGG